ncbi:hypothetical protein KJ853_01860 [Patescibacteria group bacterium]|nr:hypothetical protein [Patescibacteria group bacterium]
MPEIIPAIIAKNLEEVKEKIKLVESCVEGVQLDISDGVFTTMKTWPYFVEATKGKDEPERLKNIETKLALEVHLMISQPEKEIDRWIASGAKRILVHFESTERLPEIIEKVKNAGLETGIVLNLQTPVNVLDGLSLMSDIGVVQLMGISEIGYYGHPFSEQVLPKIFTLRDKCPDVKIAVDGGINKETALKAAQMGADILVAGSAIFESGDIRGIIEELKNLLNNIKK